MSDEYMTRLIERTEDFAEIGLTVHTDLSDKYGWFASANDHDLDEDFVVFEGDFADTRERALASLQENANRDIRAHQVRQFAKFLLFG